MMAWSSKIHSEIRHNTKHHHLPFWFNQLECQASGLRSKSDICFRLTRVHKTWTRSNGSRALTLQNHDGAFRRPLGPPALLSEGEGNLLPRVDAGCLQHMRASIYNKILTPTLCAMLLIFMLVASLCPLPHEPCLTLHCAPPTLPMTQQYRIARVAPRIWYT